MAIFNKIQTKLPVVLLFAILSTATLFLLAACGEHGVTTAGQNQGVLLYSSDPDIELYPTAKSFCEVENGSNDTFTLTISNNGAELPLQINSLIFLEGNYFRIYNPPPIPSTILPGESLEIPITFEPLFQQSGYAILQIGSNDPDEPEVLFYMGGNGVSEKTSPEDQIAYILNFIEDAIDQETLTGLGPGNSAPNRLNAFTNMIKTAGSYIEEGNFTEAAGQLHAAYHKTDEQLNPPDFVTGQAAQPLASMIQCLRSELEKTQQ
jgi:hypothetical protein